MRRGPLDFLRAGDPRGLALRLVLAEVLGPPRGLIRHAPPRPPPPREAPKPGGQK